MNESSAPKQLRMWPGLLIVVLQWFAWMIVPRFGPEAALYGVSAGAFGGALAMILWWLFFSRAPWLDRLGALFVMVVAVFVTSHLLHESVAQGNMGFQYYVYLGPVLSLAFIVWGFAARRLADTPRRATMVATILLACGGFALLRSEGLTGVGSAEFVFRWAPTPEERLLAQGGDEPAKSPSTMMSEEVGAAWPGFRGPDRDGIIRGVRIETDWTQSPPAELWRRPVGPGTSSFAVGRELLYTQEQRGEEEVVACYRLSSGEPVWRHRDKARFWDSYVGVGPRATPALKDDRVYSLGATGILNALDARSGAVVWSRNAASDTGARLPFWGFVSSPLVLDDLVVVYTDQLVAYDLADGDLRWTGPDSGSSYGSPHLLTLDKVAQILIVGAGGATSVAPVDGALFWKHSWPGIGVVQPALTSQGSILISMIDDLALPIGTRHIAVGHGTDGWTASERWTSRRLKPSFSSVVVHEGHAFGFDPDILTCIDLQDGRRKWKGGRYGTAQLLLLPEQDLLLVLSERGELVLVAAAPEKLDEIARFPAIEGKTWSQPTLVGDILLVRNGQEMAAFRLSLLNDRIGS